MKLKKHIGIVLQGGGALGAYQLGALKYLYERYENLNPVVVTGVSIGAINAAVLIGGREKDPIKNLEILWDRLKMPDNPFLPSNWQAKASKLGNPNMYYPNPQLMLSPLTTTNLYDLTPFRNFLEEFIDFDKLNSLSSPQVVVEAVNVETGELQRFKNHDGTEKIGLDVDKVLASMSIPPNFPAVYTEGGYFWDGGLYANMPLAPAINALEHHDELDKASDERLLFVINLFRKQSAMPESITAITDRIKELMFESKLNLDTDSFDKMDELIDFFAGLDEVLPEDSILRESPVFKRIRKKKSIKLQAILQYEAEGVEGTDDFTPQAIDARIRNGYYDAQQAAKEIIKDRTARKQLREMKHEIDQLKKKLSTQKS